MRDLAKFLYTHNPFYLLSAASVLFGLRTAFDSGGNPTAANAWVLAGALAGYAVLLTATAVLIVRIGKVWDDARTIALLVVLMVLAISCSFDRLCMDAPVTAVTLFAVSLAFALILIEGLIRGLRIRFPWSSRLPLYLLVALFFVFPVTINHAFWDKLGIGLPWRIALFPTFAGALSLSLLPAIWQTSKRFENNGSPWAWPWYPWSVFFFVGVAICGRSYLLTLAFQADVGFESTFGGYYLVPLGFAVLFLLSEIAIVEKAKTLRELLLLAPFCLMLLALIPGGGTAYAAFYDEFTKTIGSPLWLTVLGCLVFSMYFYFRHAEQKTAMIQAVLIAMTFIDPSDTRLPSLVPQNWWPLAIVGVVQLAMLFKERTASRFLKGWGLLIAALSIWGWNGEFTQHFGILPLHLILFGAILASVFFDDGLANWLRKRLPVLVLGLAVAAVALILLRSDLRRTAIIYISALVVTTLLVWYWHRMKLWKWASLGCCVTLCLTLIGAGGSLWNMPSRSTQALLVGAACFVFGCAISAAKAGLASGVAGRLRREWEQLIDEWNR